MRLAAPLATLRTLMTLGLAAGLSACAGHHVAQISAVQEAQRYQARAAHDYTPPGPPEDPWGPYISEASKRFDVPERWIREVMHQESGGRLYSAGGLTTSPVGAMGLMQVMPETFDMLRIRYNLGDDAYDPHNNLLAGTAYVREMYDLYGSPGFLAAYNAGPGRLDDYLTRNRPLPEETRRYVASIGPRIMDSFPTSRAPVEQFAMNAMPVNVPAGPRYAASVPAIASSVVAEVPQASPPARLPTPTRMARDDRAEHAAPTRLATLPARMSRSQPMEVAELPEPPRPVSTPPATRFPQLQVPAHGGLHLIQSAMADTLQARHTNDAGGGQWGIQVGAYGNESQARAAASTARAHGGGSLAGAHETVGSVAQGHGTLYRARLTGLSRDAASQACERLGHHGSCLVLSPQSRS